MKRWIFSLLALLLAVGAGRGDAPLPARVFNPQGAAEAWNVIRLATANVERLVAEKRLREIAEQASLCSPALRALAATGATEAEKKKLAGETVGAFRELGSLVQAATAGDGETARRALAGLRGELAAFAREFDAKAVAAEIFHCPMHPDFVSTEAAAPCAKCGMALIPRRIPYSFIYTAPGQPTVALSATADGPLTAGKKATVTVRMQRGDGSPVAAADLLVMHTQPIHLLIVDPTLGDYHHEHPAATGTPGEYAFSFTPERSAPYRIFADIVPAATGVQEYPFTDLPGAGAGGMVAAGDDHFDATAGALHFHLAVDRGAPLPPRAGETRLLTVTVSDAAGQPVAQLEPVMNAFAHLVGFYEDYRSVVHLHPAGGEVRRADLRGGPAMEFKFFAPRAGHLRLYCQVLLAGRMIFAPFDLNIAP